jgi:hypothetical protein
MPASARPRAPPIGISFLRLLDPPRSRFPSLPPPPFNQRDVTAVGFFSSSAASSPHPRAERPAKHGKRALALARVAGGVVMPRTSVLEAATLTPPAHTTRHRGGRSGVGWTRWIRSGEVGALAVAISAGWAGRGEWGDWERKTTRTRTGKTGKPPRRSYDHARLVFRLRLLDTPPPPAPPPDILTCPHPPFHFKPPLLPFPLRRTLPRTYAAATEDDVEFFPYNIWPRSTPQVPR